MKIIALHLKCFFFLLLFGVEIGRTEIRTRPLRSLKERPSVVKKNVGQKMVFQHVRVELLGHKSFKLLKHLNTERRNSVSL